MAYGSTAYGFNYGGLGAGPSPSLANNLATILNSQGVLKNMKAQFIASENLRIVFPPFLDTANNVFVTAADVATLAIVKPNGSLYTPAPTLIRDANNDFWTAEIAAANFEVGEWTIKAVSSAANTLPQYQSVVWGDYMTEIRQATLGRWKITGTQLQLFEDDGVTVFKTFDLKDASGVPSASQIFERDPV